MPSTSLRHFHTRKLTALSPIYPEPIHERANGLQNAGDIIVEIYWNPLEFIRCARIHTHIHTYVRTAIRIRSHLSIQLGIIGRSRRITTRSARSNAYYPRNDDYFVTPPRPVNSRGSLEIRSQVRYVRISSLKWEHGDRREAVPKCVTLSPRTNVSIRGSSARRVSVIILY